MKNQIHLGTKADGKKVWHSNDDGTFWSGWTPERVTKWELFIVCATTIADLIAEYPYLPNKLYKLLKEENNENS